MKLDINWEQVLAPNQDWQTAYPIVEQAAKAVLTALEPGVKITTTTLARRIWPDVDKPSKATPERRKAVKRLFRALQEGCARHSMPEWTTLAAAPKRAYGRVITPRYWFNPAKPIASEW